MPHSGLDIYEAEDPDEGTLRISVSKSDSSVARFGFRPKLEPGEDYATLMSQTQALKTEDGSHYRLREFHLARAKISGSSGDETGSYFYSAEEGKRLIEIARTRPAVGPADEQLTAAGFKASSHLGEGVKTYTKKVPKGYLTIYRGPIHVHAIFDKSRVSGWTNLYRSHAWLVTHQGELWPIFRPSYLDGHDIAVHLAIQTSAQYITEGYNAKRRK